MLIFTNVLMFWTWTEVLFYLNSYIYERLSYVILYTEVIKEENSDLWEIEDNYVQENMMSFGMYLFQIWRSRIRCKHFNCGFHLWLHNNNDKISKLSNGNTHICSIAKQSLSWEIVKGIQTVPVLLKTATGTKCKWKVVRLTHSICHYTQWHIIFWRLWATKNHVMKTM